jgi:hypothetical protein
MPTIVQRSITAYLLLFVLYPVVSGCSQGSARGKDARSVMQDLAPASRAGDTTRLLQDGVSGSRWGATSSPPASSGATTWT